MFHGRRAWLRGHPCPKERLPLGLRLGGPPPEGAARHLPGGLAFRSELDRTYISGIERGVRNPTLLSLRRLAKALGVAPSGILRAAEGKG